MWAEFKDLTQLGAVRKPLLPNPGLRHAAYAYYFAKLRIDKRKFSGYDVMA